MENDIVVRKVVQDVQMFIWFKQEQLKKKPRPELSFVPDITAEFMNNLCISVWIDSYQNEFIWKEYIRKHYNRITASPFLFANYVYYACHILNRNTTNAYERFCGTLSLVTHFVLYCMQNSHREFLFTNVELFCAFFEKKIRSAFEEQGGWKNFNEYLVENHEGLKRFKELIKANKGEFEIFKEIQEEYLEDDETYVINEVVLKDITETQVEDNIEAIGFADSVLSKMVHLRKQTFEEAIADFAKTDEQVEKLYRQAAGEATGGIENEAEQSSLQKDQEGIDVKANESEQSSLQKDQEGIDVKANESEQSSLQKDQEGIDVRANESEQSSLQKDQEGIYVKANESSLQKDQEAFGKATKVEQSASQGVQKEISEKNTSKTSSEKNEDQTLDLDSLKSQDCSPATQKSDPRPKLTNAKKAQMLLQNMKDDVPKIYELIKYICNYGNPAVQMVSTVQTV